MKNKHFAIDIALTNDTPIKAILSGTIIFADWSPSSGNVIILRHNNGFISVYKDVASLSKLQGDIVKTGEVIALAGSKGKSLQERIYISNFGKMVIQLIRHNS